MKLHDDAKRKWKKEYGERRRDEKWEKWQDFFAQPFVLLPRAMRPQDPQKKE